MFLIYFIFLFNPELLVVVCFFLFFFFALLQEKGQLGSYLQELSLDARSKLDRHLAVRENMIHEFALYLERSVTKMRDVIRSFENASLDTLMSLQFVIKKLSFTYTVLWVRYFLSAIESRTQFLSLQIRLYLTHGLLAGKPYTLVPLSKGVTARKLKVLAFA